MKDTYSKLFMKMNYYSILILMISNYLGYVYFKDIHSNILII